MPRIPLNDPRYITNLSVKSGDLNLISRNEGGNLIKDPTTDSVLYIEPTKFTYDNNSINNVLKTNFEYYKFPSRILVVDDVDLNNIPVEDLNIEDPIGPIKIRYRLNKQVVPIVLTQAETAEKVKNNDTNHRFFTDSTGYSYPSRIEGSFQELQLANVLEGLPQTIPNRFVVTQDILDRKADLSFNINVALRMTDNAGRNNYAVRLLKYNPNTNKYSIIAQKTSESPKYNLYNSYISRKKREELDEFDKRTGYIDMDVETIAKMKSNDRSVQISLVNAREKIIKKWDNYNRNLIPETELNDAGPAYQSNLEASIINTAAAIKTRELLIIKTLTDVIQTYNKLINTSIKVPISAADIGSSTSELRSIILKQKSILEYKKLSVSDKIVLNNKSSAYVQSLNLISLQIKSLTNKLENDKRELTKLADNIKPVPLTELLTDGVTNIQSKAGYLWSNDIPYGIAINEIIPKEQLKLHESYAVELVASKHNQIPHELIEDQTFWQISELQVSNVVPKVNDTNLAQQSTSFINSSQVTASFAANAPTSANNSVVDTISREKALALAEFDSKYKLISLDPKEFVESVLKLPVVQRNQQIAWFDLRAQIAAGWDKKIKEATNP